MRYDTIILDQTAWDMVLDTRGDIAMASPPYALAQDVASAIKTFRGEVWYDGTKGIPYFEEILGFLPPISLIVERMKNSALTVPGVVSTRIDLTRFDNRERTVHGQILFIDEVGAENGITF